MDPLTTGPRVVVADDDELVRSGISALLRTRGVDVVAEAPDGATALTQVSRLRPDVLLLDLRMPGLPGLTVLEEVIRRGMATRVVILTTFDLDELVRGALAAGAAGYLLKSSTPDRLAESVKAAHRGDRVLAPALTDRLIGSYLRQPTPTAQPAELGSLTDRELEVFTLIASGLTNEQIRDQLVISDATVKTHINHIFRKLDLTTRTQTTVIAYETGLLTPGTTRASK